ncbi:MAG: hypothetical protein ABI809_14445, partial [Caldimonas sp.]
MQLDTGRGAAIATDAARSGPGWLARRMPSLLELAFVLAAIAVLLPQFDRVAAIGAGRDHRFADDGLRVEGLPEPTLPAVCAAYGAAAEERVRAPLCGSISIDAGSRAIAGLPDSLSRAAVHAARAFVAPLREAEARVAALQARRRDGADGVRDSADAAAAIEAEVQPYVERYQLTDGDDSGPRPLACAMRWAEAALAAGPRADRGAETARADAVLLFAAALDGRAATESVA